jgi:DNA adenine methylase
MRTPITYYGGKQSMLNEILPKIPKHRVYVEPFFGGGAVFFAKQPSYLEAINDINNRLVIFYEMMRDNFEKLSEMVATTLHSEAMHQRAKDIYNNRLPGTDLEIAWSVWVVTNMSFGGSIHGGWKWCNGSAGSHSGRFIKKRAIEFQTLHNRLQDVQISCRNAIKVIEGRDSEDTFYYFDPPYPGAVQGHYYGYAMKEFVQLLDTLQGIKGKFLLSNFWSQTLKYYTIKNGWEHSTITKQMKVANFNDVRYKKEVLISNYTTEPDLFNQ